MYVPPCERKLKHEEHRKDRSQNSPSPSYYDTVCQVHTVARVDGWCASGAWTMPKSHWQCPEYLQRPGPKADPLQPT